MLVVCVQDFPLYTNREIVQQLGKLKGRNMLGGYKPTDPVSVNRNKYVHK